MRVTRQQGLGIAALITMVLVVWTAWRDEELPAITEVRTPNRSSRAALAPTPSRPVSTELHSANSTSEPLLVNREPLLEATSDPFRPINFVAPPPKVLTPLPAPPPPPPPKPVAPAFPYQYFGRMLGLDGKLTTYLVRGDTLIAIREQDIVDNTYRVDSIIETQIVLTYLPLNEKTVLLTPTAAH
ncbi:hypothetical protein [Undibacterium flavidum]|uniref:Secretion system X translation initiation factor n=1 Tax=Undibacterium flavidum TaxID=2762297 RepID=A0ABR6YB97_9BURK|nr:hypothetical protein [Undibacterium flavidum]MBC3873839.1 hypothetical protein [Undibacterium flavidum]